MSSPLSPPCRVLLGQLTAAVDDGNAARARGVALEMAALGGAEHTVVAARCLYLLRDYPTALALLEGGGKRAMTWRYSMLKRLRFDVEAGAVMTALLQRHPSRAVTEAAVHYYRTTSRPREALTHAMALAEASSRSAVECVELAAAAGDTEAAARAAAWTLERDPTTFSLIAPMLVQAGAYDALRAAASGREGGEAMTAQLRLFAGDWQEAQRLADAVLARNPDHELATEVALGAAVLGHQHDRAHAMYSAIASPSPTALAWRAALALNQGDPDTAVPLGKRAGNRVPDFLAAKLLWTLAEPPTQASPIGTKEGLLEGQLAALGAAPRVEDGRVSGAELHACAQRALDQLRGNLTPYPSVVADGNLRRVWPPESTRHRVRRLQHSAAHAGIARAIDLVDAAVPAAHPVALCYRGELDLWAGHYDEAARVFRRCIDMRRETVWAWIGLGAALTLSGSPADGLARIDEGVQVLGWRGATVPVYRAEALMHLGRADQALEELDNADRANPDRLATQVLRVLCLDAAGRATDDAFARLAETAPALTADAASTIDVPPWWPRRLEGPACVAVARAALRLMRGNRSSGCTLWFAPGSEVERTFIAGRPPTSPDAERDERAALDRLTRP